MSDRRTINYIGLAACLLAAVTLVGVLSYILGDWRPVVAAVVAAVVIAAVILAVRERR